MVHDRVKLTPVKDRLRDTCGNAHDGDAHNVLNQKKEDGAAHGYTSLSASDTSTSITNGPLGRIPI